jgi:hypothetical protein
MYHYEILELSAVAGVALPPARVGWVESAEPITLSQAARIVICARPNVGREHDVSMKREISVNAPDSALFVCERKGKSSLVVFEWPADMALKARLNGSRVFTVSESGVSEILWNPSFQHFIANQAKV